MRKYIVLLLALVCALALVGCHSSPKVTENNGQYQVYLKSDIRTEVLSKTSDSKEEMGLSITFQTSEGPKSVFVEVWVRSGEEAQWDLLESKTLFLADSADCNIPAENQYMVHVSKVEGNNGNVTLEIKTK